MKTWTNAEVVELSIVATENIESDINGVDEVVYIDGEKWYRPGIKDGSGTPETMGDYTGM